MESALAQIASQGVLGALVVILGIAYLNLQKQYRKVMDDRVADAKKVTETVLGVNREWAQVMDAHTKALDRMVQHFNRGPTPSVGDHR